MRMLAAFILIFLGGTGLAFAADPVPGRDYIVIADGKPYQPRKGVVEVVEVFGYTCIHCSNFQPLLASWQRKQAAWVQVRPLTLSFNANWTPYAQAYYAADELGVLGKTHDEMFKAIHVMHALPLQGASSDLVSDWYAKFGVDPKRFLRTMSDGSVASQIDRASAFVSRSGVDGVPSMIVNGKYRVAPGDFQQMLRVVDYLVAKERAASGQ